MDVRFRPLRWQGTSTPAHQRRSRYQFKAAWSNTLDLLDRELRHLSARDVVIEADFREQDIRLDGWPRSNARVPVHPGIRIAFESKHGPLVYATDSCEFWQHNVRSIGLGLEALRAVDRYGVTRRGEQYTGWRQIGSGPAVITESPRAVLAELARLDADEPLDRLLRFARRNAHPDQGGTSETWTRFEVASKAVQ